VGEAFRIVCSFFFPPKRSAPSRRMAAFSYLIILSFFSFLSQMKSVRSMDVFFSFFFSLFYHPEVSHETVLPLPPRGLKRDMTLDRLPTKVLLPPAMASNSFFLPLFRLSWSKDVPFSSLGRLLFFFFFFFRFFFDVYLYRRCQDFFFSMVRDFLPFLFLYSTDLAPAFSYLPSRQD